MGNIPEVTDPFYHSYENAVTIVFLMVGLVIWLRDRIVPHLTKECFVFLILCTAVNLYLFNFYYEDFPVIFRLNEYGAVNELEQHTLVYGIAGSLLGVMVFGIGKAYVWTLTGYHALMYVPFYGFCAAFLFSPKQTPKPVRAVILIINYMSICMFACTVMALTLGAGHFRGTTQVITLYQAAVSLAAFFILLDLVPVSQRRHGRLIFKSDWTFYADRYIDSPMSIAGIFFGTILYAVSYIIYVGFLKFELLEWNLCAVTLTMIGTSMLRAVWAKKAMSPTAGT